MAEGGPAAGSGDGPSADIVPGVAASLPVGMKRSGWEAEVEDADTDVKRLRGQAASTRDQVIRLRDQAARLREQAARQRKRGRWQQAKELLVEAKEEADKLAKEAKELTAEANALQQANTVHDPFNTALSLSSDDMKQKRFGTLPPVGLLERGDALMLARRVWEKEWKLQQAQPSTIQDKSKHSILATAAFSGVGKTTLLDHLCHEEFPAFCKDNDISACCHLLVSYNGMDKVDFTDTESDVVRAHEDSPRAMLAWRLLCAATRTTGSFLRYFEDVVIRQPHFKQLPLEKVISHVLQLLSLEGSKLALLICVDETVKMLAETPAELMRHSNHTQKVVATLAALAAAAQACNTGTTFVRVAVSSLWVKIPMDVQTQSGRPVEFLPTPLLSSPLREPGQTEGFSTEHLPAHLQRAAEQVLLQCGGHPKSLVAMTEWMSDNRGILDVDEFKREALQKIGSVWESIGATASLDVLEIVARREKPQDTTLHLAAGTLLEVANASGSILTCPQPVLRAAIKSENRPPWSLLRSSTIFQGHSIAVDSEKEFERSVMNYVHFLCHIFSTAPGFTAEGFFGSGLSIGNGIDPNQTYEVKKVTCQRTRLAEATPDDLSTKFLYATQQNEPGIEGCFPLTCSGSNHQVLVLVQVKWVAKSEMPSWRAKANDIKLCLRSKLPDWLIYTVYLVQRTMPTTGSVKLEEGEMHVHGQDAMRTFLSLLAGPDQRWSKR